MPFQHDRPYGTQYMSYADNDETRTLGREAAKSLSPGSRHYTAFVGPPQQYDFMGATQFRLLTTLGLREHHRLLDLRAGRLLIPYLLPDRYDWNQIPGWSKMQSSMSLARHKSTSNARPFATMPTLP
jgi:hypothetical protein